MDNYGLKILKRNKPITAIDPRDIQFTSSKNFLRFHKKLRGSIATDGSGNGSLLLNHGLKYPPPFFSFIKATAEKPDDAGTTVANAWFSSEGEEHAWYFGGKDFSNEGSFNSKTTSEVLQLVVAGNTINSSFETTGLIFINPIQYFSGKGVTPISDYGLKVSRSEKDVFLENIYNTVFNSVNKPPRLVKTGTKKIALSAYSTLDGEDVQTVDVEHGLGYAPFFIVYVRGTDIDGNIWRIEPRISLGPVDDIVGSYEAFVTNNIIRFSCWRWAKDEGFFGQVTWDAEDVYFRYYLFDEPLNAD